MSRTHTAARREPLPRVRLQGFWTEKEDQMTGKRLGIQHAGLAALLVVATGLLAGPGTAEAQVQRGQPTTHVAGPPNPQVLEAMVNPLQARVQSLEQEVKRLEAALESLRLSMKANQEQFAKHQHRIPNFGVLNAKSIYPGTNVSDDTLVAVTCGPCVKSGLSGPPE